MPIKCMICLSNIYPSESADSTDCGHVFHASCLNQWHLQSTTCPQCRAFCATRNIRRLHFTSSVNSSNADISRNAQLFDEANLQLRNLTSIGETNTELKEIIIKKSREILELSETYLNCLENLRRFEARKLNVATGQINYLKMEHKRLGNLEKKPKENTKELPGMDVAKNFINSSASEVEALLNETPESLANMVIILRGQLITKEMKKKEVFNALRVSRVENVKLNVNKRQLRERFSSLPTDKNEEN